MSRDSDDGNRRGDIVLTKAIKGLAEFLNLKRKDLISIVGLSEATWSRIYKGADVLNSKSKEGQLAIGLVRVYRSLYVILGGDSKACETWIHGKNLQWNLTPLELMESPEGLFKVVNYLDCMRGKN